MNKRQEHLQAFTNSVKQGRAYRRELIKQILALVKEDDQNEAKITVVEHRTIRELNDQCQKLEQVISLLKDE